MRVRRGTSRRSKLAAVLAVALVGTVTTTLAGTATAGERTATAHRAGGATIGTTSIKPKLFDIGHHAGEPTIGIARDGSVFYTAGAGCVTSCTGDKAMLETVAPGGRAVMMTPDKGKTWKNVSPGLAAQGISPHATSLDPMLFVDHNSDSDRVFDIDLNAACAELSYSDDHGKTWITNPLACGEPVNDHQTLFSGKPTTTPAALMPLYSKVLYYCYNKLAYTKCSKSLDGGVTFVDTTGLTNPECSGLNGHGVTDSKGTIFLPYTGCSNAPAIAVSKDEGNTWEILKVPGEKVNGGDPSVAIDRQDNVYFLWNDADRKVKLATSTTHGKTWSKPLDVTAPGVKVTDLATLTVGAPGKVAIAYLGTTSTEKKAFWNGYLAAGVDVLTKNPTFYSASVNDPKHPLKATGGSNTSCGPGRCGRILDFLDVEIAPDGAPWGAYVDACYDVCEKTGVETYADNEGMAGTLVGGPRLNR